MRKIVDIKKEYKIPTEIVIHRWNERVVSKNLKFAWGRKSNCARCAQ